VDWTMFIPEQFEALIINTIREVGADKLRPIKDALPDEVDYLAIKSVIVKHKLTETAQ
jgi:ATP-dependent DNA helicase RecQ